MKKGTKVIVQRDETKYPPKGTWPWYRGKKGVVVTNLIHPSEYGVSFTGGDSADAYFKEYELTERK